MKSNIVKNRIAHSDDIGILSTVSGYTINARPGPEQIISIYKVNGNKKFVQLKTRGR